MNDIEKQKFQLKTIFLSFFLSLVVTSVVTTWGYSHSANKELLDSVGNKVNKPDFIIYQQDVKEQFEKVRVENNANWVTMDKKIDAIYLYLLNEKPKK